MRVHYNLSGVQQYNLILIPPICMSLLVSLPSIVPASDEQQDLELFSTATQISLLVLAVVSSLSTHRCSSVSILFPLLYYVRRKCTEHPSALIAIISLLEALSNYNVILIAVNIYQFEHFVNINRIFDVLVFYRLGEPTESQFCEINFTIYIILELMSIAYNISFSADLLITLKKPFFAGRRRMKFYHALCAVIVCCSLPMSIVEAEDICNEEFHSRSIYKIPMAFLATLVLFYIISIVIIILSFRTVQKNQIRLKYIYMHRIILFTLMLLWAFPIATNVFILLNDQSSTLFHVFNLASFVSLLLSGAIINIVRFYNDPYVWLQIKNTVKECKLFESKKKEEDEQEHKHEDVNDRWNLPLANAVATFHHQSVVSNIIQIVLETCTNTVEELAIKKSEFRHSIQQKYHVQSAILSLKEIKKMLRSGTKQQVKRLSKITKTESMMCLEPKDAREIDKNIYKEADYIASLSPVNDSNNPTVTVMMDRKNNAAITIKVESFADPVFVALRLLDNITSEELMKTLDLSLNAENIKKARESLGASGSFFFFSYDHRLVIKTINETECKVFLKILPEYYEHILNNPNSLISRTYGLFSVEIAGISKIYFVMMENTLRNFEDNGVTYRKYDLKGSTIKREVKNHKADVLKDINLLKSDDAFLIMSAERKHRLIEQIKTDITLLSKQNIMDYSLLLGIGFYKKIKKPHHLIIKEEDLEKVDNEWRCFDDGHLITGKMYTLSIIDYLQEFDANKYIELKLKKVFKGGGDISSVDTKSYFDRFLNFVNRIVVVCRT